MKRNFVVTALAAICFATFVGMAPAAQAAPAGGCTLATLTGGYGFTLSGFNGGAAEAVEGLMTFDGAGNLSTSFTFARNGVIGRFTDKPGTYTVNSDCTGSITVTAFGVTFDSVIVNGGKEILAIRTDDKLTETADFKKQ